MSELTRKRIHDHPQNWAVNFAGVRVGTISEQSGSPINADRWKWHCGFYPGTHLRNHRDGTAPNFEAAHAAFEQAWREFLPLCTEEAFALWRHHQAATAEKYARFDRGERMPPNSKPPRHGG